MTFQISQAIISQIAKIAISVYMYPLLGPNHDKSAQNTRFKPQIKGFPLKTSKILQNIQIGTFSILSDISPEK